MKKFKRVLYWLNGLGFFFTELILFTLVITHVIHEWVLVFININLIVYMFEVRNLRYKLAEYEQKRK